VLDSRELTARRGADVAGGAVGQGQPELCETTYDAAELHAAQIIAPSELTLAPKPMQ